MRTKLRPIAARRGGRLRRFKPLLAMLALAVLALWAAADVPFNLYAAQAKAATRPIPGAGTKLDVAALSKIIDDEIAQRLQQEKIQPSPKADDSTFLRRASLDLVGVIPSTERVKEFLDSKDPNKREKLVDELLANSRFGKQQSEIWMHQIISADLENRLLPTENLRKWLENAFNNNKPWSKIVEELVTASGTMDDNPATMFFIANKGTDKVTGQVSRLFLGLQLQCAQCHNHPFTDWKQDEYWGMAAFFMKVKQDGNAKMVAKNGGTITVSEIVAPGPKAGKAGKKKGVEIPEGIKYVPPRFITGEQPKMDKKGAARPVLARWMTSTSNPYFAKAMVNRTWAHFFGRGFVNAIDDMHNDNPATHPELLLALAEQFKRHDFDLKYLVKAIVLSETYQRSSKPFQGNGSDAEFFSRMYMRTMSPEQLVDSVFTVVGVPPDKSGLLAKKGAAPKDKKGKGKGGTPRDQLIRFFSVEEGGDPLEYQDGIPQVLRIMNGPLFNNGGKALVAGMQLKTTSEAIDYFYLSVLARHPTMEEDQRLTAYVSKQPNKRTGYSDVLWTLLNSSEFRLNH